MPETELVKKHKVGVYVNNGTAQVPSWVRIEKATDFEISMNPVTEERDYIADEHPTTELMDYKPSAELAITTYKGNPDFDMMYKLYQKKALGADAQKDLLIVHIFNSKCVTEEDTEKKYYYAEKASATLVLNSWNTSGATLSATANINGTIKNGYVTLGTNGEPIFTEGDFDSLGE